MFLSSHSLSCWKLICGRLVLINFRDDKFNAIIKSYRNSWLLSWLAVPFLIYSIKIKAVWIDSPTGLSIAFLRNKKNLFHQYYWFYLNIKLILVHQIFWNKDQTCWVPLQNSNMISNQKISHFTWIISDVEIWCDINYFLHENLHLIQMDLKYEHF